MGAVSQAWPAICGGIKMKSGRAFEIFVKTLLINVGFSEVKSDGLYIFDGSPGQMIQGLGEAHNADVLLEPPVQTPFLSPARLLIECKDYSKKVGLNTLRSALGLREDINHFDIVDMKELSARKSQRRKGIIYKYQRFSYQVAVAALNGYTVQAQKFAVTHRIPLLAFDKMPFWNRFMKMFENIINSEDADDIEIEAGIMELANDIGDRIAMAITDSGQMLFLYRIYGDTNGFSDDYFLHWENPERPWPLVSGGQRYLFQLPDHIMKQWLSNAESGIEMRIRAIDYKERFFSNMIVYYSEGGRPAIKMISIDQYELEKAKRRFENGSDEGERQ